MNTLYWLVKLHSDVDPRIEFAGIVVAIDEADAIISSASFLNDYINAMCPGLDHTLVQITVEAYNPSIHREVDKYPRIGNF